MGIAWSYTPPAVNAIPVVAAAAALAAEAGAKVVLAEAQRLIPVDTGTARDSGRVVMDGAEAYWTFGKDDDGSEGHAPSNQYIVPLHEHIDDHHPNGGQAKFGEVAEHTKATEVAASIAADLRKVIGP